MRQHPRFADAGTRALAVVTRFMRDDSGDDLIEYALLTTTVGLVGIVAMTFLSNQIRDAYNSWNVGQQNLYKPDPPQ